MINHSSIQTKVSLSSTSPSCHKLFLVPLRQDYSSSSWRICVQCQSLITKTGTYETCRNGNNLYFSIYNFMGLACVKRSETFTLREGIKPWSKKIPSPWPVHGSLQLQKTSDTQIRWSNFNNEKLIGWKKLHTTFMLQWETRDQRDQKAFQKFTQKSETDPLLPRMLDY